MTSQPGPRRIWRIVFVSSLALNLLLVGVIGGAFIRGGGGPPRGFELQLGPLSNALEREDRRVIGAQIRRAIGPSGQSRAQRRATFEALIMAVEAQPFDPEALVVSIRDQQQRQDEIRSTALDAFVTHLTNMTADDRAAFARKLRDSYARRGGRDGTPPSDNSGG